MRGRQDTGEPAVEVGRQKGMHVRLSLLTALTTSALLLGACSTSSDRLPSLEEALRQQSEGLTQPSDALAVGDARAGCGFPRTSKLTLLDPGSGDVRWNEAVPWTAAEPAVLDGSVVTVSRYIDGNPPSVSALDLATGRPLWQRFVATEAMGLAAIGDGAVVVATGDGRFLAVQADGESAPLDDAGARRLLGHEELVLHGVDGGVTVQAPGTSRPAVTAEPGIVADDGNRVVTVDGDRETARSLTGSRWVTGPLGDGDFDTPVSVVADDGRVLVSIASSVGPNRRIVVLDADTGDELWSLDGVRDATLAGDLVVYDQRSTDGGETTTRTVTVAGADDATPLASAATGLSLGGFAGRVGDTLLFTDGRSGVTVAVPDGPVPSPLFPAGDPNRPAPRAAMSESMSVVAHGQDVSAFAADGTPGWQWTADHEVQSLRLTDAGVLVWSGDDDYGCE